VPAESCTRTAALEARNAAINTTDTYSHQERDYHHNPNSVLSKVKFSENESRNNHQ